MDYWPAVLVNPGDGPMLIDQQSISTAHRSARRPNLTLSHSHGRTGSDSGIYKAGNDCDASKLDFRRTEILGEGCADAMSANSSLSLAATSMRFKAAGSFGVRCHPKRPVMSRGFGWRLGWATPPSTAFCLEWGCSAGQSPHPQVRGQLK
jgi:hypothetical protein